MSTAIIALDLKGRFSYLNTSAEKALGITARNLVGKRYNYFIEAETLPIREWFKQLQDSDTTIFDKRLVSFKNQLTIEAELALQTIEHQEQTYLLIEWLNSPLANRHQQEQELLRQQQIQQQLLKNLAHEIKTPLSGIAGAAQLLQLSEPEGDSELSQIIQKEVKRLSQLVDRMLLGQKKASRMLMNIHEIIEDVIRFVQLKPQGELTIQRDYDPSLPELEIAPEQMYQVLLNLTQNAMDALTETNDPCITFKTRITKEHPLSPQLNQALLVSIIDNGLGIPEDIQANIFFPMISGKNSSGLGLGIAQSLMQQHQGLIEFESTEGRTQFHCYLPINSTSESS